MSIHHVLAVVVAGLLSIDNAICLAADEQFEFATSGNVGPRRVAVELEVGGELKTAKVEGDAKNQSLPMSVVATLLYDQIESGVGDTHRALRQYSAASAVIKVEQSGQKTELPATHRRIAVTVADGSPALYCPDGALSREQLDLIDVPLARIRIEDLLPKKSIKLGESWVIPDAVICSMLGLEALDFAELSGMLAEVKGDEARLAIAGTVRGGIGGIGTEIQFKSRIAFDLKVKQVSSVQAFIEEKRAIGHVGPGLDVAAKLVMTFSNSPDSLLNSEQLQALPARPSAEQLQLSYASAEHGFQFSHDRRWFVTSDQKNLVILRMIDRGELLAQCSVSTVVGDSGGQLSLEGFQSEVQRSLGKHFGKFLKAGETAAAGGGRMYRVVAGGTVSDLPINWVYYWISNPAGTPISMAFTFEESLSARFSDADRAIADSARMRPAQQANRKSMLR